jgi:sigma-B regulation protein RsbU (phosphoserine phosphatase)
MVTNSFFSSQSDFDDFFDSSLCGYIITDGEGIIKRINKRASEWLNNISDKFVGQRFTNILTIGGKIYFETHLWPLLKMQGYFDEVAVELIDSGSGKLPIYINGYEKKDENGKSTYIQFTLFRGADRRLYEENLQIAKKLAESNLELEQQNALIREQFIAVLGHDLRNPLAGIMSAAQLLARTKRDQRDDKLVNVIQSGSKRMYEMINNIMDLAHGRLGGGISINPVDSDLENILNPISAELSVAWPDRIIQSDFDICRQIKCDPARISQLVSNLLANAITHGASNAPILFSAVTTEKFWEISVRNQGIPISQKALPYIFLPFRRETEEASSGGLGLGLYIAMEIAKAHNGTLKVLSDDQGTCFTFTSKF